MKSVVVFCALLAAASAGGFYISKDADVKKLHRQALVLSLHFRIQEPELVGIHVDAMENFTLEHIKDNFKDRKLVERFMYYFDHHVFLPRNEDFSLAYEPHFWQMQQMFEVLYSAPDFDTFFKTAVWMRLNMNERMFIYVFNTVLQRREDTQDFMVPPPYEVFPQYFVTSDVIQRTYEIYLRGLGKQEMPYVIVANYTGFPDGLDAESLLSYFREDVGLNSYWTLCAYKLPFWLPKLEDLHYVLKYRGQVFYTVIRNLLARYDMERYSNGMTPVLPVELWEPVEGYNPKLRHQNGHEFPARPEGLRPKSTNELYIEDLMDWERRIRDGVAMSIYLDDKVKIKQLTPENAMNTLGFMINGGDGSPNEKYYGSIFYGLFTIYGRIMDPHHKYAMAPSTLEVPETMLRDPLFYRLCKRMWMIIDSYKDTLPPYQEADLLVPGLKIDGMKVDKLLTFFDDFHFRVDNMIDLQKGLDVNKVYVMARQHRLNHRPFSYTMKVTSDKDTTAVVRVFLGPRIGWNENRWTEEDRRHHFYILDAFSTELNTGMNTITRNSSEFFLVGEDSLGMMEILEKTYEEASGQGKFVVGENKLKFEGFPHRLLLPRGSRNGLPVTLFAIVTDAKESEAEWERQVFGDGRDEFFPLDRRVFFWELETLPNAHFEDLTIYHRHKEDINDSEE